MIDRTQVPRGQQQPMLSVVVPCFNEEGVIAETHKRLSAILAEIEAMSVEILYVDDGSSDGTPSVLRTIQTGDPAVRVITLSRNFGHQVAVTAGLEHACGAAVVLIDADLQDPPEVIRDFVREWRNGGDVVYGVRSERAGESAFKVATAKAFYRIINKLSDTPIPLDTGDFRLMDRRVVDAFLKMPERARFVRGMVSWTGFRQIPVHYSRAARFAGQTKYPLSKMISFATDGIISFSYVPLRLAIWMGFASACLALVGVLYALVVRLLTDDWVQGWALLFIALMFLGGIQLVFLGVIGEYLGRVYGEVKQRPLYLVKERLGFPADSPKAMPVGTH